MSTTAALADPPSTGPGPHRRLSVSRALGRVVVTFHGELVDDDAMLVGQVLSDLVDGQGNLDVVIDCRYVTAIDEVGAAVVVAAAKRTAARRGRFALSGGSEPVRAALVALA